MCKTRHNKISVGSLSKHMLAPDFGINLCFIAICYYRFAARSDTPGSGHPHLVLVLQTAVLDSHKFIIFIGVVLQTCKG